MEIVQLYFKTKYDHIVGFLCNNVVKGSFSQRRQEACGADTLVAQTLTCRTPAAQEPAEGWSLREPDHFSTCLWAHNISAQEPTGMFPEALPLWELPETPYEVLFPQNAEPKLR